MNKGWGRRITNICKSCYLYIKCFPTNSLAALMWRWCLNSKQAALQLVVEGSRRRFKEMWDGTERNSQNLTHTCTVRMVQKSWYITWKGTKKKKNKNKNREKSKFKKDNSKRKNLVLRIRQFWLSWGWFLDLARITILPKYS